MKKQMKMGFIRTLAMLLASLMVVTAIPEVALNVQAESNQAYDVELTETIEGENTESVSGDDACVGDISGGDIFNPEMPEIQEPILEIPEMEKSVIEEVSCGDASIDNSEKMETQFAPENTTNTTTFKTEENVVGGACGAEGDNVKWSLNLDTGVLNISGSGAMKNWDIFNDDYPDWYSNYKDTIVAVIIENGVTTIGACSFYECSKLNSITIASTVTIIEPYAFSCSSLKKINNQEIGDLRVPDTIKKIETGAFAYTEFDNLYLGGNLETVDRTLVCGCELDKIYLEEEIELKTESSWYSYLPNGKYFGETRSITEDNGKTYKTVANMFYNTLILGENISYEWWIDYKKYPVYSNGKISYYAVNSFLEYGLKNEIVVEEANEDFVSKKGILYRIDGDMVELLMIPNEMVVSEIPNDFAITAIGENAFSKNQNLQGKLVIPETVTSIKEYAFKECDNITEVVLPSKLTQLGYEAFAYCDNLTTVNIPRTLENNCINGDNDYACFARTPLKNITFEEGTKRVSSGLFAGCYLESITLPNTLTSLGDNTFSQCDNLTSIEIPEGVVELGGACFNSSGLKTIILPSTLRFTDCIFWGCSLESIIVKNKNYFEEDWSWYDENTAIYGYVNSYIHSCAIINEVPFYDIETGLLCETKDYSIFYRGLEDAINHPDNVVQYNAGETVELKEPTKENAKFKGWFLEDGTSITSVSGKSVTVYAKWEMSLSTSYLELNFDSEEGKKGTIKVYNATTAPTYVSSNTDVATVKALSYNQYEATVTAVGVGETTITVKAGEETQTVLVSVTKSPIVAESIILTGVSNEMVTGEYATLKAEVMPLDAWTSQSRITYTSSDSSVVEILDTSEGKTCEILTHTPGVATITATLQAEGSEELTATFDITVKGVFTGEEREALIKEIGELYFLEGADKSLKDLPLPVNWSWSNPDCVPDANSSMPYQYFTAVYTREGYEPLEAQISVGVTEITDIKIYGTEDAVIRETSIGCYYKWEQEGCYLPENSIKSSWTCNEGLKLLSETNKEWVDVYVINDGNLNLAVEFTNPRTGKSVRKEVTASITVTDFYIMMAPEEEQPEAVIPVREWDCIDGIRICINAEKFNKKSASKLALTTTVGDSQEVNWVTTDASIMTVDKKGLVTIKKPGVAVIRATRGEEVTKIEIRVEDYKPILENKSVTIYQNKQDPTVLGLIEQNGNEIYDVKIIGADNLSVEEREDAKWYLRASGYEKKTTEKVNVFVYTYYREEPYEYSLKVVVDVTKPDTKTVKFKQIVKPNVFYCGEEAIDAEFTVSSSKYVIESIFSDKDASNQYVVKEYNPVTGKLIMRAEDLSKETIDSYNFTSTVYVKVKGYEAVPMKLKIGKQNKKLSLKLGDATLISGTTTADINLYSGKNIVDTYGMTFGDTTIEEVSVTENYGTVSVDYTGSKKSASYKVNVSKDTWTTDVVVSGKVSVVDPKKLVIVPSVSKVTINTTEGYRESVIVSASIKGNNMLPVTYTAKDTKQVLSVNEYDESSFEITAPENVSKGSYTVQISGTINGVAVKSAKVNVTLTDKAPDVKLTGKGTINLANRYNTSVTYTPSLKNLSADLSIWDVFLDETSSEWFEAHLNEDGKVEVHALSGVNIKANQKYNLGITFILNNGMEVSPSKTVVIKPVDKLPKVKATAISGNLYKTDLSHEAKYQLNMENGYYISKLIVEPDKKGTQENFFVYLDENNTVNISLRDTAIKSGTYQLSCKLLIEEADNSKPVKVKLKVTVK